jgi:hypothetical protein
LSLTKKKGNDENENVLLLFDRWKKGHWLSAGQPKIQSDAAMLLIRHALMHQSIRAFGHFQLQYPIPLFQSALLAT